MCCFHSLFPVNCFEALSFFIKCLQLHFWSLWSFRENNYVYNIMYYYYYYIIYISKLVNYIITLWGVSLHKFTEKKRVVTHLCFPIHHPFFFFPKTFKTAKSILLMSMAFSHFSYNKSEYSSLIFNIEFISYSKIWPRKHSHQGAVTASANDH